MAVFDILRKLFSPQTHADMQAMWDVADIGPPCQSLFARALGGIPYHRIRYLIATCLDNKVKIPVFLEQETTETIPLREIYGCTHSKSPCGDFNAMNTRPIHDTETADILASTIFAGSGDCVAQNGDHADVIRQAWDGKQWFMNYGGSHRAAALHAFDQQQGIDRPIQCTVTTVSPAPQLIAFAENNQLFLIKTNNQEGFQDMWLELMQSRSDIKIRHVNNDGHFSVQFPRGTNEALGHMLQNKGCFDVSAWILNPAAYTFDKTAYLICPAPSRP